MPFRSDPSQFRDRAQERRIFKLRAIFAFALVCVLSLVLVVRLVYLQVSQHQKYAELAAQNRIQQQPIAPPRGLIYDTSGELLALNQPVKDLVIVLEQVDDIDATLDVLRTLVDLNDDQIEAFEKRAQRRRRPFEAVTLKSRLTAEEVARISVDNHRLRGVSIEARLARYYPHDHLVTHALGYVGRINVKELERVDARNYSATEYHGKLGVERFYEDQLHGQVGMREVETNARGRVMRVISQQDPTPGADLTLYLNIQLQQAAEDALAGQKGAVVAMDPNTGGILAMVSVPSYDPNPFVTGISSKAYQALRDDPRLPLYNRAIRGQYRRDQPSSLTLPWRVWRTKPMTGIGASSIRASISWTAKGVAIGTGSVGGTVGCGWMTASSKAATSCFMTWRYAQALMAYPIFSRGLGLAASKAWIFGATLRYFAVAGVEKDAPRKCLVSRRDGHHRHWAGLLVDDASAIGQQHGGVGQSGCVA